MIVLDAFIVAIPSFAIGVGSTIVAVRRGLVSEESCKTCKTSLNTSFQGQGEKIDTLCEDVKGLYRKHDETNKTLNELVGFLKGKGIKGEGA